MIANGQLINFATAAVQAGPPKNKVARPQPPAITKEYASHLCCRHRRDLIQSRIKEEGLASGVKVMKRTVTTQAAAKNLTAALAKMTTR
jgi:hypothetical protein